MYKNKLFKINDPIKYLNKYFEDKYNLISKIDNKLFLEIIKVVDKTIKKNNTIFVCGNGGSASTSNHFCCDFIKQISENTKFNPKVFSLSNNLETITAIANDISFNKIFSFQAKNLIEKNDLIIIFSVSGNSKNLVELIKYSKIKKIKIISFTGQKNSFVTKNSNLNLNFESKNYGIVEDIHLSIMHLMAQILSKINS
jgi:D-sedoheptulose 7-phosphate isomerase